MRLDPIFFIRSHSFLLISLHSIRYDTANGQTTISNDGATILKLLEVVHPASKCLVDIARAQDAEVGDGTTSVVLLAGELLRESKAFIEDGVSPHIIIKGYRRAAQLVSSFIALHRIAQLMTRLIGCSTS